MKIIINILVFSFSIICLIQNTAFATNYYFSTITGKDSRTSIEAQNPLTPWKSIDCLNTKFSLLLPGDSVLFARGEIFSGTINVTKSGTLNLPIVFSSYGIGDKPIITGMKTLSGWVSIDNGIWESKCLTCGDSVNVLVINDCLIAPGRYPNANSPNKGYLKFQSHLGKTQITDSILTYSPDWTGAEIIIRSNNWIIDRSKIISQNGGEYKFSPPLTYEPINNFGYFIQNHITTLDLNNEWCFNSSSKSIDVFNGINVPTDNFEVSVLKYLITINNCNNLILENIKFEGANENIIDIKNCQNMVIKQCEIIFSGVNIINGINTKYLSITDNFISNSNNNAINLYQNCNHTKIYNNVIYKSGMNPGLGKGGDGNYNAIRIFGNNNVITLNRIDSTGYIPINYFGDSTYIDKNFINSFTLIKDDGGGIYTWTGSGNSSGKGSKIIQNIIINGKGSPEGTKSKMAYGNGIYMDDNTSYVEIINNSISNCSYAGILLNNTNRVICKNNILFDNGSQLVMNHTNLSCNKCQIYNNYLKNNIFFSKIPNQLIANFISFNNDIEQFGVLDSNYYCRPLDRNYEIFVSNGPAGRNAHDLLSWQTEFHQDLHSKKGPFPIHYYKLKSIAGADKFSNCEFDFGISGLYAWTQAGECFKKWDNTGKLDGGSLQVSATYGPDLKNHASIIIGIDSITAGKNYIMQMTTLGTKKNKTISAYLRQSNSPYSQLTQTNYCLVNDTRSENEFLFTPKFTEKNASIGIDIDEGDGTLWLDNIELFEANVDITNPDDYIRFEYNATTADKTIQLTDTMYDVKNTMHTGSVVLSPFSSIILLKKPAATSDNIVHLLAKTEAINTFPNPATDIINVILPEHKVRFMTYQIYDTYGKLVLQDELTINQSENDFHVHIHTLKAGLYVMKVTEDDCTYVGKFVKR